MKLSVIQREHKKWVEHNFPGAIIQDAILGIMEEHGELIDAINNISVEFADYCAQVEDSAADCAIYAMYVATLRGLSVETCYAKFANEKFANSEREITSRIGLIAKAALKEIEGIRYTPEQIQDMFADGIGGLYRALEMFSKQYGFELFDAIQDTWKKEVSKRDWKKYPGNGIDADIEQAKRVV